MSDKDPIERFMELADNPDELSEYQDQIIKHDVELMELAKKLDDCEDCSDSIEGICIFHRQDARNTIKKLLNNDD